MHQLSLSTLIYYSPPRIVERTEKSFVVQQSSRRHYFARLIFAFTFLGLALLFLATGLISTPALVYAAGAVVLVTSCLPFEKIVTFNVKGRVISIAQRGPLGTSRQTIDAGSLEWIGARTLNARDPIANASPVDITIAFSADASRQALFRTSRDDALEFLAELDHLVARPWRIHTYPPDSDPALFSSAND